MLLLGILGISVEMTGGVETTNHPNMYLNINDIENIKNKKGQEPWKTAYDKLMSNANSMLSKSPPSVTYGGKTPPGGDKHDYFSEIPYSSDGVFDPNSDRTDYDSAKALGKSVRDLGLAYALTGEEKYADKALEFIRVWTVDPSTKMNPKFTNDQSRIELSITIPGMFYGADLIWNYPGWDSSDRATFKDWTKKILASSKTWSRDNNFENWKLVFISSAAVIVEDSDSLDYAFERWKDLIPDQMNKDGSMKYEIRRTRSLTYSAYAINAMIQTAEIARHQGVNLYNYELDDGRGLEKALDFLAPYVANPSKWPYEQIDSFDGDEDNAALYELAYTFKNKDTYKKAIDKWGRPMYDIRTMGPVTLTHANGNFNIGPRPTPRTVPDDKPGVKIGIKNTPISISFTRVLYKHDRDVEHRPPTPNPTPTSTVPTPMPTVPVPTPPGDDNDKVPPGYDLFWSENFDNQIDTNKWIIWNTDDGYWNPNNVKNENGNLKFIGERDSDDNLRTGSIRSKETFQYGYISIKAKLTKGKGFMSQLWMNSLAPKSCDPNPPHLTGTYPEIDLNEMPGDDVDTVSNTIHWWTSGCDGGIKQKVSRPDLDLTKDFHYYGVEWDNDNIRFYLDGQVIYSLPNEIYEPMSIVLGLCIARNNGECGGSNGFDSSTSFPGNMYVDFVKVYKKT